MFFFFQLDTPSMNVRGCVHNVQVETTLIIVRANKMLLKNMDNCSLQFQYYAVIDITCPWVRHTPR